MAVGGYEALARAVTEMKPSEVIEEIRKSGLRGRGGAGYPTGLKWDIARKAAGDQKYVVCNADEGDPGAFMDRSVLEGDPHRVLEGMAIAGYAIGASQGYIYVRAEYPLAIERLKLAIRQAERHGVLGSRIFESGFNFRIDLRIGAGAFVCGEETALHPLDRGPARPAAAATAVPVGEGPVRHADGHQQRRDARQRRAHPHEGQRVVRGDRHAAQHGTKVFALAGKIRNTGLIEVPDGHPAAPDHLRHRRRAARRAPSSRPRRPAARRAAASRPSTSTCRWTTSRSPPWARSWAAAD